MGKIENDSGVQKVIQDRLQELVNKYESQGKFATQADISIHSVQSYFREDSKTPSISTLIKIAKNCNESLDWLCGLKDDRPTVMPSDEYYYISLYKAIKDYFFQISVDRDKRVINFTCSNQDIYSFIAEIIEFFYNEKMVEEAIKRKVDPNPIKIEI